MSTGAFNGYKPVPLSEGEDLYGPDPYDYNFCTPIDFSRLENNRVALVPLIPRIHAQHWVEQSNQHPSFEAWLTFRHETIEQLLQKLELWRRNPEQIAFAIIDKGRPGQAPVVPGGSFAGIIGLLHYSPRTLSTEIAPVMTFPAFQRTYVTSNAVGLLLRYCLDVPAQGGLGLRRVQWISNPLNTASVNAAKRMGFKSEGILRWTMLLKDNKKVGHGRALREGDPLPTQPGRDDEVLSLCCDDWEAGGRELVQTLVDRK